MNLSEFSKKIVIDASKVAGNINQVVRKTALAIDRVVVLATPVDTGRARSNWIASVGSPSKTVIGPYNPGTSLGLGEGGNAQAAMAQAAGTVASRQEGQDIYISNNLEYIETLNSGSSSQAPSGFVEKAVQEGARVVQSSKVTP